MPRDDAAAADTARAGRRLTVDVTDLLEYLVDNDILHGVQNVVMSLLCSLHARGPAGCRLVGFHPVFGRPFVVDLAALAPAVFTSPAALKAHLGIDGRRPVKSRAAIRSRYGRRPLRQVFELAKRGLRQAARRLSAPAAPLRFVADAARVAFAADDVLLLPGLNVWYPEHNEAMARAARRSAARVVVVVHDLGPLTAPQYFPPEYGAAFARWLDGLTAHADLFLSDSEYTDRALRDRLARQGRATPSRVVPLAHELARRAAEPVRNEIAALAAEDFVLCVGRIEPRKNLVMLVRVWLALAREMGARMPRLVLAGRANARDILADLEAAARAAPELVHLVASPNDTELARLYAACRFSVYPSLHEGWGLPVGEAASFGKLTAASRATSIPEVVGPLAVYFDPHDAADMRAVLQRLLGAPEELAAREARLRAEFRPRTWADVAAATLAAIDGAFTPAESRQP